jgi:hypothetical protein
MRAFFRLAIPIRACPSVRCSLHHTCSTAAAVDRPGPSLSAHPFDLRVAGRFDLRVAGRADQVGSVVLLRSDHNTHSLTTGDRYVKLPFARGGGAAGDLRVKAPDLPAQAIPGIYLLYVVDTNGVPSVGRRVDIKTAPEP